MPIYHLRVAWREDSGVVRPPLCDDPIEAPSLRDAITVALARSQQLLTEGTNLAWLVGPDGHMAWSLRMDEDSAVAI
ncbi:hypothetical protein [Methylobacterium nigriterrae]|uniref:hypothetical protein n=1 Tax=Methylobacterium nigriterrae TaxID=3127512 RepID=UPI0030134BC4